MATEFKSTESFVSIRSNIFFQILLISLVGLVAAKPTADAYAPVYGYYTNPLAVASNQFHAQDEIGQYNYGYSNQVTTSSITNTF